ncbi:MAG: transcription antitermination factor NusB [Gemmatimonadales bacterium]
MGGSLESAGGHAELTIPRIAAFRILEDVEQGAYADRAAKRRLAGLLPLERGLALELAYGAIRLRARLDVELLHLVDRPLERLDRAVLLWLRLGLYQLRETRVPDHAAVHETIEGLRSTEGPRAVGFVNAVLRSAARLGDEERAALFPSLEADPISHLATYGSHPEWLVRRWLERWPTETVVRLVELDNRPARVTLRTLGDEGGRWEAERRAAADARLEAIAGFPGCWELADGDPKDLLAALPAIVQDPAASAVVEYIGPLGGGLSVDVCAAPGGKCIALAAARETGSIVAADLGRERLMRVVEAARARDVDLLALVADGRKPPFRAARNVLLDAPCSGTGVLRRRADARWRVRPGRLAALVKLQRELLDAAAELVEPGGTLVYATCSLEPEENEGQVSDFLSRQAHFSRCPTPRRPAIPSDALGVDGELRVLPWQRETDGSYAVRLRRAA